MAVGYISDNPLFRDLTIEEAEEFRKWARENYKPGGEINALWHPVVRYECGLINNEAALVTAHCYVSSGRSLERVCQSGVSSVTLLNPRATVSGPPD